MLPFGSPLPLSPWFWFAPQIHFPGSGSVAQHIEPKTFFDAIPPHAGNGKIEEDIFAHASYGKQIGLLMEVVLDLAKQITPTTAAESHTRLKALQAEIEAIKTAHMVSTSESLHEALLRFKKDNPTAFEALMTRVL
jgi:hypothetical protein